MFIKEMSTHFYNFSESEVNIKLFMTEDEVKHFGGNCRYILVLIKLLIDSLDAKEKK